MLYGEIGGEAKVMPVKLGTSSFFSILPQSQYLTDINIFMNMCIK